MFLDVEYLILRSLSLALPLTAVSILIKELIVSGEVVLNDQFLIFFLNFRNEMRFVRCHYKSFLCYAQINITSSFIHWLL